MAGLERLFWYLNFAATLALLARLLRLKLLSSYRWLFLYWVAQAMAAVVMFRLPVKSVRYAQFYYAAQTVSLLLAIFVVLELYHAALSGHPALAGFGRKSVIVLMAVAAAIALGGVMLDSAIPVGQTLLVHRFLTMERTVSMMILAFLLLISGFLLWFPVKIKRNVAIYITGFVLFYCSRSLGILLVNVLPQAALQSLSITVMGLTLGCLALWFIGLRAESDDVITVTGGPSSVLARERMSQLDQINTALARFARNP